MRYGDSGEDVRQVQQRLIASGYPLPRYGADGALGDETWNALRAYARDHALPWTPTVPAETVAALTATATPMPTPTTSPSPSPVGVVDLTAAQTNPPAEPSQFKLSSGKVVVRDPGSVTGIMLHQTGVWFSVADYQVAEAGGDRHAALHNRALRVACHLIAFDGHEAKLECGHVVWPNPLDWYVYQANLANAESIGIECEGLYPGLESQAGATPSARLIAAARDAVRFSVEQGRSLGMPIQYIWAHRQSSALRQGDPGESLWRSVVLEYAVPVLGLQTQTSRTWGDGRPVPIQWDPAGVGTY